MEPNEEKQNKWQKYQLLLALIATALLAVMVGTQAWLSYMRRLETAATVDMPTLILQGPRDPDIEPIELGDIDVTQASPSYYVFSVVSVDADAYQLQLAHTTNIPFTYKIYHAEIVSKEATVQISNNWYQKGEQLGGSYLNGDGTSDDAKKSLHAQTYGTYNNVQINAEPLYWQSNRVEIPNNEQDYHRDYYILEIGWGENLKNNKETDMVYLTVGLIGDTNNTGTGGTQ